MLSSRAVIALVPEGDTIHHAADRLAGALTGQTVVAATGSHRAMREFGRRVTGRDVTSVTAHGKHLLIHFSNDWTLRSHMGMTGVWHLYSREENWRKSEGKARVVLTTDVHVAVCFAAPTVELAPRHIVARSIEDLGPDLMDAGIDVEDIVASVNTRPGDTAVCDVIVDQQLMAGLGNVYKSEVLYLEHIHPDTAISEVTTHQLSTLIERGSRLLQANRAGANRTTTGERSRDGRLWVYGRAGKPCRRCDTSIEFGRRGPLNRTTYWCPRCQPAIPSNV